MSRNWMLILGLILIVVALVGMVAVIAISADRLRTTTGIGPQQTFQSNGERIYYTATSASGEPITFTGGPHWLRMHGGSCVSCHGPQGTGGAVVPMTGEVAPDIRFSSLTSPEQAEEADHPPFTEDDIKRAITDGIEPDGERLSTIMPRWRMSEGDLDDVVEHLKALGGDGR